MKREKIAELNRNSERIPFPLQGGQQGAFLFLIYVKYHLVNKDVML